MKEVNFNNGAAWIADDRALYNRQAAAYDATNNARLSGKFQASDVAALWGKVIPITWGTRRITGQLLQIGPQAQKTVVAERPMFPPVIDTLGIGDRSTAEGVYFNPQTVFTSTFAYVFGQPGNPAARQILRKLWFDNQLIFDIDQGAISSEIIFRFYQGDELQTPDVELNRDRYDYPVAYRGMLYIVFYNYAMNDKSPGSGNPLVEAEFAEELANTQPETVYDNLSGTGFGMVQTGAAYDFKRNVFYAVGTGNIIYKYDSNTKQLLDSYPITNIVANPPGSFTTASFKNYIYCSFRLNGVFYLFGKATLSNSDQVFLINADTGAVVSSLGKNGSSLDPDGAGGPWFPGIAEASVAVVSTPRGSEAYISTGGIFAYSFKFRVSADGGLSYLGYDEISGGMGRSAVVAENDSLSNYTAGESVGTTLYRNGVSVLTTEHRIDYLLPSPFDDAIVVFSSNYPGNEWNITKYYSKDMSIAWAYDELNAPPGVDAPEPALTDWIAKSYTGGRRIAWLLRDNHVVTLDLLSGQIDAIPTVLPVSSVDFIYDAYSHGFNYVSSGDTVTYLKILNQSTTNMPLSTLLTNLAERQGYETADITVEGINDTIIGAAITERTDLNSLLADIKVAFNFEILKRGRKIKFTRRAYGADFEVDAVLLEEQLALQSESENEFITVESEMVPPAQTAGTVRIRYIDPAYAYTVNEYVHKRNSDDADQSVERVLNLPIIMGTQEAAALAMRVLLDDAMNGVQHVFRLPQRYLAHEPGDTFQLVLDGYTDTVRAREIAYNGDWSMTVTSEAIYTDLSPEDFTFVETELPPELPPLLQGEAQPIIFDTTLLVYTDQQDGDQLEMYASAIASGRLPIVGINTLYKAPNTPVQQISDAMRYGRGIDTLSATAPLMAVNYDDTFRFRVIVGDGSEYASDTVLNVLAGSNRLLVGNTGRWEQIGFIDAAYDATTKIVTLTGIIRGLRGTDYAAPYHSGGDYVVSITDDSLILIANDIDELGNSIAYAVANSTGQVNADDAVVATIAGAARQPWMVANVHAVAASGDVGLSWQRRTRLYGPLLNGSPTVPVDETSEEYELQIYRAGAVVRTVTGLSSPAYNYTAAQQAADGWSGAITSIQVDIWQLSSLVGRGFTKAGTYDVE